MQHQEKNDSFGYPGGLKGAEILLEAKIMDVALNEIIGNKDISYDGKMLDICVTLFKKKGFKFQ